MYKLQTTVQLVFENFNQPIGLKMNPSNRWIQKAELIPWAELEKGCAKNFRNKNGNVAKPFRMAFGALLIQKEYSYNDEETVLQIQENRYDVYRKMRWHRSSLAVGRFEIAEEKAQNSGSTTQFWHDGSLS